MLKLWKNNFTRPFRLTCLDFKRKLVKFLTFITSRLILFLNQTVNLNYSIFFLFTCDLGSEYKETVGYPVGVILIPDKIKGLLENIQLLCAPTNLPMIVPPKPYCKNKLGGYLLNDVLDKIGIFVDKPFYIEQSKIKDNNIIYKVVNTISSVPYKVNNELLDFLYEKGR